MVWQESQVLLMEGLSNDTVIVSEGAIINADINANVILISGTVKGNIKASSRVEIIKPARFEGTITTPSLVVEEGVIFHGTTKMRDKNKQNSDLSKNEENCPFTHLQAMENC